MSPVLIRFPGDCTQNKQSIKFAVSYAWKRGRDIAYVGESVRPVRLRYNEHRRDALNKTANTPFGDHFQKEHSDKAKFRLIQIF